MEEVSVFNFSIFLILILIFLNISAPVKGLHRYVQVGVEVEPGRRAGKFRWRRRSQFSLGTRFEQNINHLLSPLFVSILDIELLGTSLLLLCTAFNFSFQLFVFFVFLCTSLYFFLFLSHCHCQSSSNCLLLNEYF